MPSWHRTPTAPRNFNGAISVMYIGSKQVARPPESPVRHSEILTDLADQFRNAICYKQVCFLKTYWLTGEHSAEQQKLNRVYRSHEQEQDASHDAADISHAQRNFPSESVAEPATDQRSRDASDEKDRHYGRPEYLQLVVGQLHVVLFLDTALAERLDELQAENMLQQWNI